MRNLLLGIILGSLLTTAAVGAADYLGTGSGNFLHPSDVQSTLGEIRVREALESIQLQRQGYLDNQVNQMGKAPCR